jgi:anti-sigma B factor antagonist
VAAPKQPREVLAAAIDPVGLRIGVSELGTTTTLEFYGEWGLAERDGARAAIEQALERSPECIVLDLSRVSFIDSTGIHVVVTAAKRCGERNVHMVIIPGPPQVQRVFEISQLTKLLPFASQASGGCRSSGAARP